MSPRKTNSNNPRDWLFFAEGELDALRLLTEKKVAFVMCWSKCAEVLEKLMKADLVWMGWPLLKTHDLQNLLGELTARNSPNVEHLRPLAETLSESYLAGRYPGFDMLDDENWPELEELLAKVNAYADDVKKRLNIL